MGRVASTLQRFTEDDVQFADISFYSKDLVAATYRVDLEKITAEQFQPLGSNENSPSITAIDIIAPRSTENKQHFTWGVGPYIAHRLFNPDLPLSMETGIEVEAGYQINNGLRISGAVRKSILTNLTDNNRRSNSVLPRVHSDWPLRHPRASGHIHDGPVNESSAGALRPGLGLEPFFKVVVNCYTSQRIGLLNGRGCPSRAQERLRHAF